MTLTETIVGKMYSSQVNQHAQRSVDEHKSISLRQGRDRALVSQDIRLKIGIPPTESRRASKSYAIEKYELFKWFVEQIFLDVVSG